MELDELSSDSTISYSSEAQNEIPLFFETSDITYIPKVEELKPKITNIVSSINLGCNLNLKNIALKLKNAEFNSNKISTIILKSKDIKVTSTIFSNGKMICSGAKNEKESKLACKKFSKIVKKMGYNVELRDFKIQNIVASYDIKFKISLLDLYNKLNFMINNSKNFGNNNNYCKFNKELFPTLIFYINESKISLLFFESGKVVLYGAKNIKEIEDIFKKMYPYLIESKKEKQI